MHVSKQIFLSALFVILTLAGCGKVETTDIEHIQRAKQFQEQGDARSTIIELKNALKKNPNNIEARWLLGELYLEMGSGAEAEKELSRARELGISDEAIVPLLLKAMLIQDKYADVVDFSIANVKGDKAVAEVLASKGIANVFQQDLEKAKSELESALKRNPESLHALVGRAQVSIGEQKFQEARSYLDKALSIKNDYIPAWTVKGDLAQIERELDQAVDAYTSAIEKSKYPEADNLLKRALVFIRLKQYDKAQADINELMKRFSKHPKVNYAQGMIYFYQEKFTESEASLETVLRLDDRDVWARYYLGVIQFLQGRHEQARDNLTRFVATTPRYAPGRKFLALIKLRDKKYAEAEELLRPVIRAMPDDIYATNFLATSLLEQGKSDEAIQLFEKVVELQPESGEARMRLGLGLLMRGDRERGFESLQSAIDISPDLHRADMLLVLNYLREGELAEAELAAEEFVRKQPNNAVAHTLMGKVYLANNRKSDARRMFTQAKKLHPGDPVANTQLAALALENDEYDQAETYYKDILIENEKHLPTLQNLAALEAKRGNREEVKRLLNEAIGIFPNAVQPRVLLAREYLKEGEPGKGRSTLGDIINENRNDPIVLAILAEIQLASREFADAKFTLQQLLKLQSGSAETHYFMAKALNGLGDREAFKKELELALELSPDLLPAKIAKTRLLLVEGNIPEARASLAELKQQDQSNNPDILSLEGILFAESGDIEQALVVYQKLFSIEPTAETLRSITRLQWIQGKKDESVTKLVDWVDDHPNDIGTMLELANSYLGLARKEDAIKQYRRVLKLSGNNLVALNNLAWHLRKADAKQALVYAEKAAEIMPDLLATMDTLAMVLLENGDTARALRTIERALDKKPDDPTLQYHQALILEGSGKKQEARDMLESLLSKQVSFRERAEAEQTLKRLNKP